MALLAKIIMASARRMPASSRRTKRPEVKEARRVMKADVVICNMIRLIFVEDFRF